MNKKNNLTNTHDIHAPLALALLTMVSEAAIWVLFGKFVTGSTAGMLVAGTLSLLLFGALIGFCFLLLDWRSFILTIAAGTIPFFFFFDVSRISVGLFALFLGSSMIPFFRLHAERHSRLQFRGWVLLRRGLPTFFTFLALFFSISVSGSSRMVAVADLLPQNLVEYGFRLFEKEGALTKNQITLPQRDETIDEFIERTLGASGVPFDALSFQDRLITVSGAREEIAQNIGVPLIGDERRSEIVFRLIEQKIGTTNVEKQFPFRLVFAFGIFALLRTLLVPVVWLNIGLFYVMLWGGLILGVFSLKTSPATITELVFTHPTTRT